MKIYIAGPMRGRPQFNFPAFHDAAKMLRDAGHEVFNPAEKDEERYGVGFAGQFPDGDIDDACAKGFNLRRALGEDLGWICAEAECVALLPGWDNSAGATAEAATAIALGLKFIFLK